MAKLPHELWLVVFQELQLCDFLAIAMVCRSLHTLAQPELCRNLDISCVRSTNVWGADGTRKPYYYTTRPLDHVREQIRHRASNHISPLVKHCVFRIGTDGDCEDYVYDPSLDPYHLRYEFEHRGLPGGCHIIHEYFDMLPKLCNLQSLTLDAVILNDSRLHQIQGIRRLRTLTLEDCAILMQKPLPQLPVDTLVLRYKNPMPKALLDTEQSLLELINPDTLRHLEISLGEMLFGARQMNFDLHSLADLSSDTLTILRIDCFAVLSQEFLRLLNQCPNIEELALTGERQYRPIRRDEIHIVPTAYLPRIKIYTGPATCLRALRNIPLPAVALHCITPDLLIDGLQETMHADCLRRLDLHLQRCWDPLALLKGCSHLLRTNFVNLEELGIFFRVVPLVSAAEVAAGSDEYMSLAFVHAHDAKEPHTDAVWGISWTATDSVLSVSADGRIKKYDSTSGQVSHALPPHTLGLVSLSVSPDGRQALYNSIEGLTSLWDLENGEVVGKFESYVRSGGEGEPSWSVSLNPLGGTYASTGGSGNITIHSAEPSTFGERKSKLSSGRNKFGMCCKHSPDGSRIALSSESGQIYIFDLQTSSLTATYTSHAMAVRSLAWSPDSQLLVSASEDKRLILHDVRLSPSGKPGSGAVASLTGHSSWVLSTDISHDGRLALSGSADKTIKVWDLSARTAVSTIQDTAEVWSVSWRPRGTTSGAFVTGGEDGVVRWWRAAGAS
ncbi:hypothetical protein JAAARDRAFT_201435 [Jaapia argillacea MUCL 33604]|uniref:F-box domain-containing protein n=1 Tax=Jaapia argillacea MUCL 33604 TaxID=933084 RepID=A0A067QMY5_9AGAM|nr:hypothetical protein JAAARDRAFT_201435 [Jaapia argillacea MUCL 33604]